jgi:hypothetical protein
MALYLIVKTIDDIIKGPRPPAPHPVEEGA